MSVAEVIALYTAGAVSGAGLIVAALVGWIRDSGKKLQKKQVEVYGAHHASSASSDIATTARGGARRRRGNNSNRGEPSSGHRRNTTGGDTTGATGVGADTRPRPIR